MLKLSGLFLGAIVIGIVLCAFALVSQAAVVPLAQTVVAEDAVRSQVTSLQKDALELPGGAPLVQRAYAVESEAGKTSAMANNRCYVMVGDSYATPRPEHNVTPWPELVALRLGLSDDDVTYIRHAGYGFAKQGKRFYALIAKEPVNKRVTDVLIVGGIGNDRHSSVAAIKKYYRKTIKLLNKKYPNARIMHAIVNWRPYDAFYKKTVSARVFLYRLLASQCGVVYLKGCESVLKGHLDWFLDDDVHPNRIGAIAIANRIVKKIRAL